MQTRIKICGITKISDALIAADLGADAIGLIFYPQSPRFVTIEQAAKIVAAVPPFVTTVGVFVDASSDFISQVLAAVPLDLLQFHGQETPDECRRYGRPYIKSVAMQPGINLVNMAEIYADAKALLLDTHHATMPGGSGKTFAWNLIPKELAKPIILAGGLTPENVGEAIGQVHPYAVDVTSGVEAEKGSKSAEKIRAFVLSVKRLY